MNDRIRDAFDGVRAEDALKQSTRAYLANKAHTSRARGPSRAVRIAAAFACVVLTALGIGGYRLYFTPVSAISVDVNPSIELGVNRFDQVVSAEGYDAEGDALAASVAMKYRDYADALDALLDSEGMKPYLTDDALVSIAVIADTDEKGAEMLARISACGFARAANVECGCVNREQADAARAAGLSPGRYRVLLALQALDPGIIDAEEARGMTMRQLRDMLEELTGESGDVPRGQGNGNGAGNGHRRHGK